MKKSIKKLALFAVLVLTLFGQGQAQDTLSTLNAEQVLHLVRQFHPVVRQAGIEVEKAKADVLLARSAFDPILSNYSSQKTFDGKNYYTHSSPEIKIPTWYGIELYGGLENLSGNRLDPTKTVGKTNYFGISIPLLKNLTMDKRRAFLQQAKLFKNMAAATQRAAINDLLMEAMEAYWLWVKAYQSYSIVKNNVLINEKRFELVKQSYQYGERPAIDTVEALSQLQSFQYQENQNWLAFQNAGLQLSAFLWKENNQPYLLPESVVPQQGWENETNISQFNLQLADLLANVDETHPELQVYPYKLDALAVDKKLKFQELLPKVDFRYNQLGKGYNWVEANAITPLFENNFQYGLKIEIPLRFSQGRGEYKKAKLKIEETRLDQNQKQLAITLKIKTYHNELINLKNQIELQSKSYSNYQQLVAAEEKRFLNGESSLFLINSRENKALEALEKLIELKTKYYKTIYSLQWSAGLLQ